MSIFTQLSYAFRSVHSNLRFGQVTFMLFPIHNAQFTVLDTEGEYPELSFHWFPSSFAIKCVCSTTI